MVRRNEKMAFAAGALVFPGGKVDPQDEDGRWQNHADGWHDVSAEQRALRIAAIRETFEETGLLVSLRSGGRECGVETTAMAREAMCAGKLDFLGFVQQAEVILDLSQTVPFANWITPEFMPKRFDTHFFILGVDTEQQVASDGSEIIHAEWIAPREALRLGLSKERILAFPTRLNLEMLADSGSVEEALTRARERVIVAVQSRIERRVSGSVLTIRSDAGYGCVEEPVSELAARGHAVPAVAGITGEVS
jgi:8-oxo-dGTP pyrophosphatase MutT (NUDIX family)